MVIKSNSTKSIIIKDEFTNSTEWSGPQGDAISDIETNNRCSGQVSLKCLRKAQIEVEEFDRSKETRKVSQRRRGRENSQGEYRIACVE